MTIRGSRLFPEQIANGLFPHRTTDFRYRACQRYIFRTDLHAVLGVTAFLDSPVAHECRQPLALEGRTCRMSVEKAHLRDGRRTYETCVFIKLGTDFHAATTRDAARERVSGLLLFHSHARAGAEIICAVNRNPGFGALEIFKQHAAIDREIANNGKL